MVEDFEGDDQEASSLGDDDHESSPPSNKSASTSEILELEEPSPDEIESNVEVDFSQPHIYDLSDGEDLDELGEEALESEESFQRWKSFGKDGRELNMLCQDRWRLLYLGYRLLRHLSG